jgi:predicted lipid carrier protein YhbT
MQPVVVAMNDTSADQAARVRAVFERLAARGHESSMQKITAEYEFRVREVGSWCLTVSSGALAVTEKPVDCENILEFDAVDFLDVAEGRQDLFATFLRGALKASGDPVLVLSLRRLMPVAR